MVSVFEDTQRRHLRGGSMTLPQYLEALVHASVRARARAPDPQLPPAPPNPAPAPVPAHRSCARPKPPRFARRALSEK